MDIKYIFLSNSLPFEESGYSPQMSRKLVKLLPLGLVHSTKGDFLVDHESFRSIRNRFMERQLQIPIDYEHQTLQDVQAPAAGWIKNIVLRNDGTGPDQAISGFDLTAKGCTQSSPYPDNRLGTRIEHSSGPSLSYE